MELHLVLVSVIGYWVLVLPIARRRPERTRGYGMGMVMCPLYGAWDGAEAGGFRGAVWHVLGGVARGMRAVRVRRCVLPYVCIFGLARIGS